MPLVQILGIDGSYKSFTAANALIYDETAETYDWMFRCFAEIVGASTCAAVHLIVGDEDPGQNSALAREVCACVCVVTVYALAFVT